MAMMHSHRPGRRLVAPLFALAAILTLAVSITAQGQARGRGAAAPAPPAANPRDLQGVWSGNLRTDSKPKLRAAAQKIFDDNTEELRRKVPVTKDPVFWCTPAGVPHVYANGVHPFEILQTPARTFLFYEADRTWRTVWTDGRKMPDDVSDLWMGYSVGRWEGNEFVVETAGFNDKTWVLQGEGTTHSTNLRITERFRRVDRDNLQIKFTLTDPDYYEGPWTLTGNYRLQPKWELDESFCVPEEQQIFDQTVLSPNAKPVK
jgi:hypothetical protein